MRIKISADSTCDLSPELIETYNIGITPLYIERAGRIVATAWTSRRRRFSTTCAPARACVALLP